MAKTLDASTKYDVRYAIPTWLRDEQIRSALARGLPTLAPQPERDDPIAIVGYGPSLNDTWEKIRDFSYVMSCSGSGQFLIQRGIVPTWHAAVDPLPGHTVRLIGEPHPDVEYLICSTCNPDVFDHLKDSKVTLWHVFDSTDEGIRLIPPGAWSLMGGCDIGLRCMTLAVALGFRDLHVFGVDGSYGADGRRHAGAHPVPLPNAAEVVYDGVTYKTTTGMLTAAQQTVHEINQLGGPCAVTFYGDGLTQAMVRGTERKPASDMLYAVSKDTLISSEYVELNRQLHRTNLAYGVGAGRYGPVVEQLRDTTKAQSVLDYGCGKGYLQKALSFPIWEYDPAVVGKEESPRPADLVVCFDVLEHIEPEHLDAVLDDLRRVTKRMGYFVIHTGPSSKTLADGRNAHLIQNNAEWWVERLRSRFTIAKGFLRGPLLHILVLRKGDGIPDGVVSIVKTGGRS